MPVGWQKKTHSPASEDGLGKEISAPFLMAVLRPSGTFPSSPALSNSCWNRDWTPAGDPWFIIWRKFSEGSIMSMSD